MIFYGLSGVLAAISSTRYFIEDLIVYPWGYSFKGGPLYYLFLFQFIIAILIAFLYMGQGYTHADSYHRQRLKYFFLAVGVSFTLGSLNFLPVFGLRVYPLGSVVVSIGLLIAVYSVVQHRLMDLSLFMAKGLAYIFSIFILGVPAMFIIIFLEKYFYQQADLSFSLLLLVVGVAAALSFQKVKERMDRTMQQIIVKDKYYYHRVLDKFQQAPGDHGRSESAFAHAGRDSGAQHGGVAHLHFPLRPEKEIFRSALARGSSENNLENTSFKSGDPCIRWLQEKKEAVVRAEIERNPRRREEKEFLDMMIGLQAEVCLPLIYMDRLIGFINLGHKSREEMYYREDLDLLNTLANQLAIAIENANLYENLKKSQKFMRRADRLASLGTLISSLAHEIRNPLVSIKTFTQLLPERLEDEEFRNYFLKVASGEIDRLTTLINELLGFARPSEPNLRGEDVNALIEKMEFLIITEARKKNITISKNCSPISLWSWWMQNRSNRCC